MPGKTAHARKRSFGTEWKNFAWCLVAASILWLFTALNDEYSSSINVSARYVNLPKEKAFLNPLPDGFKVMVKAKGWDLMGNYFKTKAGTVTIDLNDYQKNDLIETRTLQDKFALLMSQKLSIGDVFPESISLAKDDLGTKKVPVKLVQDISFKDQFGLGGDIALMPDSVLISGPASVIKSIDHVETAECDLKKLDQTANTDLKLKDPGPKNISYSPSVIKIQVPVYELSKKKIHVKVQILNEELPDSLKLVPASVSLIYQAPVNRYAQIDSTQFQVIVDGSQIDTGNREPLKVQLINQPKFTYNVRLSPDYVDYVIHK